MVNMGSANHIYEKIHRVELVNKGSANRIHEEFHGRELTCILCSSYSIKKISELEHSPVAFSIPSATVLFGKKDARVAGNDRKNKTERVKKVKDDVIEIEGVVYGESYQRHVLMCHRRRSRITGARPGDQ